MKYGGIILGAMIVLSGFSLAGEELLPEAKSLRVPPEGVVAVEVAPREKARAQDRLSFLCRTASDAVLTVELALPDRKIPITIKLEPSQSFRKIELGLDDAFGLADAVWSVSGVTVRCRAAAGTEFELKDLRLASPGSASGTVPYRVFPGPAATRRPVPSPGAVGVFFELDNEDDCTAALTGKGLLENAQATGEFRARLLENAEKILRPVDSPEDADVVVYARFRPGRNGGAIAALVRAGKPLVIYGRPADPEIEALAPLALTPATAPGLPERKGAAPADPRHPLFAGTVPVPGATYLLPCTATLRRGTTLLVRTDGAPLLQQADNILQYNAGLGTSFVENGPFYNRLLLRSLLLLRPERIAELEREARSVEAARDKEERSVVRAVLGRDDPDWNLGASRENFGRFGWEIAEGLSFGSIESDFTVTNGQESFRFELFGRREDTAPVAGWCGVAVSGRPVLNEGNRADPLRPWFGEGTVEFSGTASLDPAWRGKELFFCVDKGIDDTDEVFFNGVSIGKTGSDTPDYWRCPRRYAIPESVRRYDDANRIVVRQTNLRGEASFGSRPYLASGAAPAAAPAKLTVESIDFTGKTCRIDDGKHVTTVGLTLLAPFVYFGFDRDTVDLSLEEHTAQYAVFHAGGKLRIVRLAENPVFYDRERDGELEEPWVVLFRKNWRAGRPLQLVFQHRIDRLSAKKSGDFITGIRIEAKAPLGTVAAGFPCGHAPVRADRWPGGIPPEILLRLRDAADMALARPVGCDEIFKIDREAGKVFVRNRFRFEPIVGDWSMRGTPFAVLPPLTAAAVRKNLLASTPLELQDFRQDQLYGPTLGVRGRDTVEYALDLPDDRDIVPADVLGKSDETGEINRLFTDGVRWSWGGGIRRDALTLAYPMTQKLPEFSSIDLYGFLYGFVPALQGISFLDAEARRLLEDRLRDRLILPLDAAQHKIFLRIRREPFSGLAYPVMFRAIDTLPTPFAEGFGFRVPVQYADCNEACMELAVAARYAADLLGQQGLIAANWNTIKEAMRYCFRIDDYAIQTSFCRESGETSSWDMLNAEYPGMVAFARLAVIAGDRKTADEALYRAAKRAIPTVMRLHAKEYLAGVRPDLDLSQTPVAAGYKETAIVLIGFPGVRSNRNFCVGNDLFDSSKGFPGTMARLYEKYAPKEIGAYVNEWALPALTDGTDFLMDPMYLPAASIFVADASPLRAWAKRAVKANEDHLRGDWLGMQTPYLLGSVLWRENGRIALSRFEDLRLEKLEFDPASGRLSLRCEGGTAPLLELHSDRPVERASCGGRPCSVVRTPEGFFRLPVVSGDNRFAITFQAEEGRKK